MHILLKHTLAVIVGTALLESLTCIKNPAGNDATHQQNSSRSVRGRLVDSANKPISGAVVRLFPVNYVPSLTLLKQLTIAADTTDASGDFRIPYSDSATLNLDASKDTLGVFVDSINIPVDSNDFIIPNAILKKLGMIKGISYMAGQNDTNQVRVTLYIPGTGRITKPAIGGSFSFQAVPEGRYKIIIDPTLNAFSVRIIDTLLLAGDTLDLDTVRLGIYEPDTIDIKYSSVSGIWKGGRVYRLFNNVEIPAGADLRILPGSTVLLMGNFSIRNYGKLFVDGAKDSLISLKYGFDDGYWNGISGLGEGISISYSILEQMMTGITIGGVNVPVAIHNNVFRYSQRGLYVNACNAGVKVYNNIFHDIIEMPSGADWAVSFHTSSGTASFPVLFCNNIILRAITGLAIENTDSIKLQMKANLVSNCSNNSFALTPIGNSIETPFTPADTTLTQYVDPQLIGTVRHQEDYHLAAESPCKHKGVDGTDIGLYSTYDPQ